MASFEEMLESAVNHGITADAVETDQSMDILSRSMVQGMMDMLDQMSRFSDPFGQEVAPPYRAELPHGVLGNYNGDEDNLSALDASVQSFEQTGEIDIFGVDDFGDEGLLPPAGDTQPSLDVVIRSVLQRRA